LDELSCGEIRPGFEREGRGWWLFLTSKRGLAELHEEKGKISLLMC
jgi:hypothetical protein